MNEGDDSYIGKHIENYTILHKLGSGGFACVYLARNDFNEHVAIKLLNPPYNKPENQQHFLREARFLQKLNHQRYILRILEYGEYEETPYIIFEYLPGGTLRDRINTCHFTQIDYTLTILTQIGEALQAMHKLGIIHCDLKPENILFNEKGDAVVADFGIAVQSEGNKEFLGLPCGTSAYMAPEQFDGMFTKEGDQYSLGCIAYELLTGRHPFEYFLPFDPNDRQLMKERHKNTEIRAPREFNNTIPEQVEWSILRSIAKKPKKRHASIATFIRSLQSSTGMLPQSVYYFTRPLDTPATYTSSEKGVLSLIIPPHNPEVSSIDVVVHEVVQFKVHHSRSLLNPRRECLPEQTLPKNVYNNKRDDEEVHQEANLYTDPPVTLSKDHTDKKARSKTQPNPFQTLDLKLPNELTSLISQSLNALGFTLCPNTVEDRLLPRIWHYTAIKYNEFACTTTQNDLVPKYALIFLPHRFLDKGTDNNIDAVQRILSLFTDWTLIIFSDLRLNLAPPIERLLEDEGKNLRHIKLELIRQPHINELKETKGSALQKTLITRYLQLENFPKPMPQSPIEVPEDDIGKLQSFTLRFLTNNTLNIQTFLQTSASDDLKKVLVGSINFREAPETTASAIISRLNKPPYQPVSKNHTLLGEFLCLLVNKPDFVSHSDAGATKMREVIRKCRLGPPTCSCSQP